MGFVLSEMVGGNQWKGLWGDTFWHLLCWNYALLLCDSGEHCLEFDSVSTLLSPTTSNIFGDATHSSDCYVGTTPFMETAIYSPTETYNSRCCYLLFLVSLSAKYANAFASLDHVVSVLYCGSSFWVYNH